MDTRGSARSARDTGSDPGFPAYGPVDAVLGYALFYVVVARATPTVVEVFGDVVLDLPPSVVRLGLAMTLWFVLLVTVLDQLRRQLAALGLVTHDAIRPTPWARGVPSTARAVAYFAGLLVGGVLAAWLFDPAIETAVGLVRVVATLDAAAFVLGDVLRMVVFFLAYSLATRSLDRLLVGGVRLLGSE